LVPVYTTKRQLKQKSSLFAAPLIDDESNGFLR
jgi:hypothetical protein